MLIAGRKPLLVSQYIHSQPEDLHILPAEWQLRHKTTRGYRPFALRRLNSRLLYMPAECMLFVDRS